MLVLFLNAGGVKATRLPAENICRVIRWLDITVTNLLNITVSYNFCIFLNFLFICQNKYQPKYQKVLCQCHRLLFIINLLVNFQTINYHYFYFWWNNHLCGTICQHIYHIVPLRTVNTCSIAPWRNSEKITMTKRICQGENIATINYKLKEMYKNTLHCYSNDIKFARQSYISQLFNSDQSAFLFFFLPSIKQRMNNFIIPKRDQVNLYTNKFINFASYLLQNNISNIRVNLLDSYRNLPNSVGIKNNLVILIPLSVSSIQFHIDSHCGLIGTDSVMCQCVTGRGRT